MSVRVRYAPSPTGSPHVGNIRTALFCHLFARKHGGTNILRLEDTDRSRFVPGTEEEIVESLEWMGIVCQEGPHVGGPFAPYRQSERMERGVYAPHVQTLIERGHAYWAFDTPEELEEMRLTQQLNKLDIGYFGGLWRDASPAKVDEAKAAGKRGVVRLKMPRGRKLVCQDVIRGRVEFDADTVDDPVLIKADGMPTYHFAAMVDDHLMEITHILRGEEWISSAPKHVWLFEAFGWEPPVFVHVPVIKGKDGAKLSKRHGDTRLLDFRSAGYLPEAMANFVALIGWSPGGDRELMTMREMEGAFELDGLQPSPGVFDLEKLGWMNGHYIRGLSDDELVGHVRTYTTNKSNRSYWAEGPHADAAVDSSLEKLEAVLSSDPHYAVEALKLEQERVATLADFGPACAFFLNDEPPMDPKAVEKWFAQPHVRALFASLLNWLSSPPSPSGSSWGGGPGRRGPDAGDCETFLRSYAESRGFDKLGPIVHPTRVAMTGKTAGPGLFELMALLGPERMARRLRRALEMLK